MFGIYRTLMALMVVATHLLLVPNVGNYAVHGFFILSGLLMTTIMHKSYGYDRKGFASYAWNRFLRLYPIYFMVLAITVIVLLVLGEENSTRFHQSIYFPDSIGLIFYNVSMLYPTLNPIELNPVLIPQVWALTVELFFYVLIGLGLSKSKKLTIGWLIFSLIFTILNLAFHANWQEFSLDEVYYFLPTGSLPFSMGALIYHYRHKIPEIEFNKKIGFILSGLFLLYLANAIGGRVVTRYFDLVFIGYASFYLNLIIHAIMIPILLQIKPEKKWKKIDTEIGNYSYPFYILHFTCGLIVSNLIFSGDMSARNLESLVVMILSVVLMTGISFLMIRFVDKPVNEYRKLFKKG